MCASAWRTIKWIQTCLSLCYETNFEKRCFKPEKITLCCSNTEPKQSDGMYCTFTHQRKPLTTVKDTLSRGEEKKGTWLVIWLLFCLHAPLGSMASTVLHWNDRRPYTAVPWDIQDASVFRTSKNKRQKYWCVCVAKSVRLSVYTRVSVSLLGSQLRCGVPH